MKGLNFTACMTALCADVAKRTAELSHVDMSRVAVRYCPVRTNGPYGIQASLTPLRFPGGSRIGFRRGVKVCIEPLVNMRGVEMLYLLSFYLPRFLDLPFMEKLATVFHELWHISPQFDGDLRRHPGRCYAHGNSERHFHAQMYPMAEQWLSLNPPPELYEFLQHDFATLCRQHGAVYGTRVRTPRLLPVRPGAEQPK